MPGHERPHAVSRRDFLRTTLAGAAALAAVTGAARAEVKRPNILLILADDVGQDAMGVYGGTSFPTPNLDALAESGMRFNHGYSMPVCHPSRVTLLTGRYPFRLGEAAWGTFPRAEEGNTIAHVLKRAGYATAVAGKWQLTLLKDDPRHPVRLGFDRYCLFGWHEGPRYYQPHIWQDGALRDDVADRYGPDVYREFLTDFMRSSGDQPFFVYYSMALCHDVTDDLEEPVPYGPRGRYDSFGEMMAEMDRQVGLLLDDLDEAGLRRDTLILFCGDNGSPVQSIISAENGAYQREPVTMTYQGVTVQGGKGSFLDGGTRVPFYASWPGVIVPRTVTDALADFSDLLPTCAEAAGAPLPESPPLDGQSFLPVLRGEREGGRPWVFAQRGEPCWVRTVRYKRYGDGRFYDLEADPSEKTPLPPDALSGEARAARDRLGTALRTLGREGAG